MQIKQRLLGLGWLVFATSALFAAGVSMPWNSGLTSISNNVTGPTALALVTIGAAGTFGPMVFHGEIPQFAHRASYVALVGGGLLAIPTIVSFFGVGGALI